MSKSTISAPRWYQGVTAYQWLVLVIASAGWIFDAFEGQIFNITRGQLLGDLLNAGDGDMLYRLIAPFFESKWKASGDAIPFFGDFFLGIFLVGGTLGGI